MFNNGNDMIMPVSPMYGGMGNNGSFFGGDGIWAVIILALLFGNGGFGGFGGWGGMMGMGMADGMMLYPWMNQAEITTDGFRDQMLQTTVQGVQNAVTSGFGDVQNSLCSGFAGVNASINGAQNAVSQQLYTNQIADLERSFASQTAISGGIQGLSSQLAQCCCDNRLATCQTQNIIQNEGNATRFADANNTRDIIQSQTSSTQAILDKLCQLELDGVKAQLAQAERENLGLQNQLNMATVQNGLNNEVDALYNRLKNCPVGTYPVCNPTTPVVTGCGCGNF